MKGELFYVVSYRYTPGAELVYHLEDICCFGTPKDLWIVAYRDGKFLKTIETSWLTRPRASLAETREKIIESARANLFAHNHGGIFLSYDVHVDEWNRLIKDGPSPSEVRDHRGNYDREWLSSTELAAREVKLKEMKP